MTEEINIPDTLYDRRKSEMTQEFFATINDFYQEGGLERPVETIGELLKSFFSANDAFEVDEETNKPLKLYKSRPEEQVEELVHSSISMINFFVKLKGTWDHFPQNEKNVLPVHLN